MFFAAIAFPPLSSPKDNSRYTGYASECSDAERAYAAFRGASIGNSDAATQKQRESSHKENVAHWCDLAAQHLAAEAGVKSANFTRLAMFAAFAGVLLLLVTLWQASLMLKEAKSTASLTREIGQKQVRAYLGITDFFFICSNEGQTVYIATKNFGASPCKNLEVTMSVFISKANITGVGNPFFDNFGDVAPGATGFVQSNLAKMDPSEFLERMSGKPIEAVGFFSYFDVFGDEQKVPFNYEGVIAGAKTDLGIQGKKPDRHHTDPRT